MEQNMHSPNDPGTGSDQQSKIRTLMAKLEDGVREFQASDKYREYLDVMSRFYRYSPNNTLLIALQKPEATLVAGYRDWQTKFGRQVRKGEKGIQIIAPVLYRKRENDGVENDQSGEKSGGVRTGDKVIAGYRISTVFDISQTEAGNRDYPEIPIHDLTGDVESFDELQQALILSAPVPVCFEDISGPAKGFYSSAERKITVRAGMSQEQTIKTLIHEIVHSLYHDSEKLREEGKVKSREQMETEAESAAYVISASFGIDTSEYSFPYVGVWSEGQDPAVWKASMACIQKYAAEVIGSVRNRMQEMQKERGRYEIWQIDPKTQAREYEFMGSDYARKQNLAICYEDYTKVYEGDIQKGTSLDTIYEKFNIEKPEDFAGHSLSVSDVVVMRRGARGEHIHAYYVEPTGWSEQPGFFLDRESLSLTRKNTAPAVRNSVGRI